MRRALLLALLVGAVLWLRRRRSRPVEAVTLGWEDGSDVTLDADSAELDEIVAAARGVAGA